MEFLTIVYLVYSFFALYYLFLFSLIYIQNRTRLYEVIKPKRNYSLSIVVPCFNAESHIRETVENLLKSDYKGLKKIIIADDCSKDNSFKIAKQLEKEYSKVKAVQTPKNTGCAAGSKNYGARFVKTELVGFTDDDSYPKPDAMSKMVGYFNDKKVGAVTSRVLVLNRKKWISKLQSIEYKIIAFTRKLLGFVDGVYVTNGPLSIYSYKAFKDVGTFKEDNWTEDIEITWHMISKDYKVHMALAAQVYTIAPDTIKGWFKQRLRWNVGGIQCVNTYKKDFLRKNILGLFIIPFFVIAWVLAITGLLVLSYRIFRTVFVRYLSTKLSIFAQTAILTMDDIYLTPSILFFFGIVLFSLGLLYSVIGLFHTRERDFRNPNIFELGFYMVFYLTAYPAILITSIYKFFKGKKTWD